MRGMENADKRQKDKARICGRDVDAGLSIEDHADEGFFKVQVVVSSRFPWNARKERLTAGHRSSEYVLRRALGWVALWTRPYAGLAL